MKVVYVHKFDIILDNFNLPFQNCKNFPSYILFELLEVEHGSPISHKNVKI